jgi:hypothetical protein
MKIIQIDTGKALQSLRPKAEWYLQNGTDLEWLDSKQTEPTKTEIDAEVIRLQAEYDALAWERSRQAEYPDWGSQLNKIYDDGLTKWKSEMVDPIKSKWPKDNSGPV